MWCFFFSCCLPHSKDKVNLPSCIVRYFLGQAPQVGGALTATCGRTRKRSTTPETWVQLAHNASFRQWKLTLEGMSADFLWVLATPNWQGCNNVQKKNRGYSETAVDDMECVMLIEVRVGGLKCKTCSWNQISGRRKCLRCVCLINAVKLQQYKHCILLNEEQRAQYHWPKYIYLHAVQL